ncbi:hypothetical protein AKJ09_05163 [Labilithrix luteola]|uniref:Uncharacterized protein n=2 Tax=Labilithrix luteola TaxID=1391654 RepID=A0A0K1PZB7_9BACT|nr:hypothetical protein AKJ09_05163 [Labilithrix luteola]
MRREVIVENAVNPKGDLQKTRRESSEAHFTPRFLEIELTVPSMPRVVGGDVFDAWSWSESDVLTWRRPLSKSSPSAALDTSAPIDGSNPAGLVFVMHAECTFLPRELAKLHASGYGLDEEWALAPYAIDDATDELFANRVRPRDVFWLAAPDLHALVWGLHDWVHFHNHGPFDDPPATELQCDLVALAWLRANRDRIGLGQDVVDRVARELAALTRRRFGDAGRPMPVDDVEGLFAAPYPSSMVYG